MQDGDKQQANFTILHLLKDAVRSIDNLQEYYDFQLRNLKRRIKKDLPKYKYGMALQHYLLAKVYPTDVPEMSENEKKLVDSILDESEVNKTDEGIRVTFALKDVDRLQDKYELNPIIATEKVWGLLKQPDALNESTLMLLLVKYEEAIFGAFEFLIKNYPDAYFKEKNISYSELLSLGEDMTRIRQYLVDKEIDELMRMPLSSWYKNFSDKHKVNISFNNNEFDEFKEIYYRRNIVVHHKGIVNDAYIKNVVNTDAKSGDKLPVTEKYIMKSFTILLIILYETFWELRKVEKQSDNEFNVFVFEQGYNYMVEKQWKLSKFIFEMMLRDKEQTSADLICEKINYWISIKNSEGLDNIRNEIDCLDVSAMQKRFWVAKYALLDDFKGISDILEHEINKEIMSNEVLEWPLFLQYRNSEEYKEFIDKHKDIFRIKGYDTSNESVNNTRNMILEVEGNIDFLDCENNNTKSKGSI